MPRPGPPRDCLTCGHAEGFHTHGVKGACGQGVCPCKAFSETPEQKHPRIIVQTVRLLISPQPPPHIEFAWGLYGNDQHMVLSLGEATDLLRSLIREIRVAKEMEARNPSREPSSTGRLR